MSRTHGPEYWWVSVGGHPAEPATLVRKTLLRDGEEKRREHVVAYTSGCGDPFFVDEDGCALKLIEQLDYPPDVEPSDYVTVPSRFHGYQNFRGASCEDAPADGAPIA